jgi:hypothetical protein
MNKEGKEKIAKKIPDTANAGIELNDCAANPANKT